MNPIVALEFVIEGLEAFVSAVNVANDALEKLKDTALTSVFETVWDKTTTAIGNFAEKVWDVASVTLGILLRDAIRGAIDLLTDLATSAFEAGAELQQVSLRLQGFNMQTLVDAGMEYNEAMTKAIDITKQQLSWVMQLAATTPYDATDIAFVFSMAEAFGYTAEQSKVLTQNTLDFVAAMGLTGLEAKRIIINLGQMAQRGKITTREMNDLARGSLVPLADILKRVAEKTHQSVADLTKAIAKPGEGVDYKLFMDAFNEMIQQEERFIGAGGRMAHTFKGAMENVWQTMRDLIGNFILLPAFLDPIGQRVGDLMDTIGEEKNWNAITGAIERIGLSLQGITTQILDVFFPSTARQTIVDRIVSTLNSISEWFNAHQREIVDFFLGTFKAGPNGKVGREGGFFKDIGKIVQDVTKFVLKLVDAFNTISDWVTKNKPTIDKFFTALGNIISKVFTGITGGIFNKGIDPKKGLEGFLDVLTRIMDYIILHQDDIAILAEDLLKLWGAFEAGKLILNTILGILEGIIGFLLLLPIRSAALDTGLAAVGAGMGITAIGTAVDENKGKIFGFLDDVPKKVDETNKKKIDWAKIFSPESISTFFTNIQTTIDEYDFNQLGHTIMKKLVDGLNNAKPLIVEFLVGKGGLVPMTETELGEPAPWLRIGVKIITEIIKGVVSVEWQLIKIIGEIIAGAFAEAFKNLPVFGGSPEGWTGRGRSAPNSEPSEPAGPRLNRRDKGNLVSTVSNAMALVSVPTSPSSSISSSAVVNNYMNLVVNSAAPVESVVQDYAMMQALVG